MKRNMRNFMMMTAFLLASAGVWAGEVTVVTQLNGVDNASAGTVTPEVSDGLCTLTVTPSDGNYLTVEGLTVVKTIDGGAAQAPRRRVDVDRTPLDVTAIDASADPSGVTVYTFNMPSEEFGVEVTANFQSRSNIQRAVVTLESYSYIYDGKAKEPAVTSVQLGETTLSAADYVVSYNNNVRVGTATVTVTGQRTYMGSVTATFTITAQDYGVTVAGVAVNNVNCDDVLGDGTVSYDPDSYTLTLNGVDLYETGETPIKSDNGILNILLIGKNVIRESSTVVEITAPNGYSALEFLSDNYTPGRLYILNSSVDESGLFPFNVSYGNYSMHQYGNTWLLAEDSWISDIETSNISIYPSESTIYFNDQKFELQGAGSNIHYRYTVAGTTSADSLYSEPFSIEYAGGICTIEYWEEDDELQEMFGDSYTPSNPASLTVILRQRPTFTPGAGEYDGLPKVTITTSEVADSDYPMTYYYFGDDDSHPIHYTEPFYVYEQTKVTAYVVDRMFDGGPLLKSDTVLARYKVGYPVIELSPGTGEYNRERQVTIINLPELNFAEGYPQAWYYLNENKNDSVQYKDGDVINVSNTTKITAYYILKTNSGKFYKSTPVSATYTFPPQVVNYDLWIAGIRVNSMNKENILVDGEKTVRYNDELKKLTLNNANIGDNIIAYGIQTNMPELTVHIVGNNKVTADKCGFFSAVNSIVHFTTPADKPGKLQIKSEKDMKNINADFGEMQLDNHWITIKPTPYLLAVDSIEVNSANYNDVLGDGTVRYDDATKTLVLDSAQICLVSSGLDSLRIHLLKNSTIAHRDTVPVITSKAAKLRFTTTPNKPGTLVLKSKKEKWISDLFTIAPFEFGLRMDTLSVDTVMIGTFAPIAPIVTDDGSGNVPMTSVNMTNDDFMAYGSAKDLSNIEIQNLLYTLHTPVEGTDNEDQGYDESDGISGVVISDMMDDDDLDWIQGLDVGSPEFAERFNGVTMLLPASIGNVIIRAKTGIGAVLKVKIGTRPPVAFEDLDYSMEVRVPYSCDEPTYAFIYRGTSNYGYPGGRNKVIHRWKGEVGHVKISNLGAANSALINNNYAEDMDNGITDQVKVFAIPSSAITPDGTGINLSFVEVETSDSPETSRGSEVAARKVSKPITELGSNVFDNVDKAAVLYVNMAESQLRNLTVNRDGGVLNGFGDHTLIYLPEGNDNGGESNVIIADTCVSLKLDDGHDFCAPRDFHAIKADVSQKFVPDTASTLFLPFGIPAQQAQPLGSFHRFNEVTGSEVVFLPYNEEEDVVANEPYLFVPAGHEMVVESVDVKATPDVPADEDFIGVYKQMLWEKPQSGTYYLTPNATPTDGVVYGAFEPVKAGTSVKAFHAYLKSTVSSSKLKVVVREVATGITQVHDTDNDPDVWYTLNGIRLTGKPSVKGLYIRNGKKEMVRP